MKKVIIALITVLLFAYYLLWDFRPFALDIIDWLWFFWEKKYLILLQNNFERRPTWWFISSFIVLTARFWYITMEIKDSYNINPPKPQVEPPYPLNSLLSGDKYYKWWVFRDANWDPDFANSAFQIHKFYDNAVTSLTPFDWIIAFDFEILWKLLSLTWELNIDWKTFNKDNYYYLIQILSKNIDLHDVDALNERKSFLSPLLSKITSYFKWHPLKIPELTSSIHKLLDQKHILLFFSSNDLQAKVKERHWAGSLDYEGGDFIHVNLANIGWRKSDRYITENYTYNVSFTNSGSAIGHLKVHVSHLGTKSLISDFYQAYLRVYLPNNIEILSINGDFKDKYRVNDEDWLKSIWWLIHLQPWEEREFNYYYKAPLSMTDYKLDIIKQPWQDNENWNISVQAPTDHVWTSNIWTVRDNLIFYNWPITWDLHLQAHNLWDTTPPIIVWQKFISDNQIEINFSENLASIDNISSTNWLQIASSSIKWSYLYLDVKGSQKGNHYKFNLNNVRDKSWNTSDPTPLSITVVRD